MAKSAYRLEDVDYDPFAPKEEAKPKYKLEDVDYDPFAKKTAKKEPEQEGPTVLPQEDTSSDFMRGVANYLPQLQETYGAAKALTGVGLTRMGATDTGKSLLESGLESMKTGQGKQVAKESDSFTNAWEKGIGTVVTDWLPYQAGAGAANIAESLAAMGVGAGIGAVTGAGVGAAPGAVAGALSKTLIKTGAKELAEKVLKEQGEEAAQKFIVNEAKKALVSKGKVAGMVGQAGLHGAGEVTGRAIEEGEKRGERAEDIELARVIPAAMVHAVSDYFINKIGLDSMKIGEGASKYLVADILKRIAVTGTKELPAEELQTVAERFGAKLSLSDAEALKEYIDTAAATYGMSTMPGSIGGVRTHLANKFATAAKEAEENADIKRTATSAQNDVAKVEPPANPELVAALTPSVDESGKALAEASEDTVAAAEALTNPIAEATTAVDESTKAEPAAKSEDVAKAEDYIQKIDSGEVQPNPSTLGAIIKKLGIPRPEKGPKFRERAVAAIKEHLAGPQQPAVTTEPIADTDRTGAGMVEPTSAEQSPAGGPTVTEPSRVVSDEATASKPFWRCAPALLTMWLR